MIPILFAENSTVFTSNGVGRLSDAFSCSVVEERNGQYELQMSYPMTGAHYSDIGIRSIIVVKPSANASLQAFRVYMISKPINGKVTINAQHISYDLTKNVTMPFSVTAASTACNTTLQGLKTNAVETCPFTFWTDVDTVASYYQKVPASIRQRLGGVEGSVLDQFGGEYEWDNWTVKLHKTRGSEKNITLRYGKNITDLNQEENIANTVTGVVPYWINTDGTESVTLTEKAVYSPNASAYSTHLTVPLDLSGEFENKPTETQLRNKATVYVNQSGFGLPKVSIKVSFINLADTEEYKDILPLQECSLCDTIKVQFERLGIDTTAKVVKTEYDVLAERYNSIEIGSLKSTLATTINDMNASMAQSIEESDRRIFADTSDLVDNATAWLTSSGGYVVAVKNTDGSWKELLFLDNRDITLARNVLRINENGIGFSSNGVGGPYGQAWTLDGHLTIGGTNDAILTVYNDQLNIIFQAAESGVIWNAANSSMDDTGRLTANNADINGKVTTQETGREYSRDYTKKIVMDSGSIKGYYNDTETFSLNNRSNSSHSVFSTLVAHDFQIQTDYLGLQGKDDITISTTLGTGDVDIDSGGDININADGDVNLYGANLASGTLTDPGGTSWTFQNGLLVGVS